MELNETTANSGDASDPRRPLTTLSLTCLVVANMIGVGVYTSSGYALASLQDPGRVVWVWGIAGLIAIAGAFSYSGLAKQVSESGGEYLFLARGVHPLAGFMAGWISLVAGFSGAVGLSALAFADHLPALDPSYRLPIAIGLVLIVSLLNWIGIGPTAKIQNGMVLVKLAILVAFGFLGIATLLQPSESMDAGANLSAIPVPWEWGAVASTLMWVSFSYAGYNAAIYIAGAARNCQASVPRAMVWGTLGVTLLYVLLNAVFVFVIPPQAFTDDNRGQVALLAASYVGGPWLVEIIRLTILVSLATSVIAMTQIGPHVYGQMARDGLLPKWLETAQATPRSGIVLQGVIVIFLIVNSSFLGLLDYLAFLLSISSAATVACLFLPAFRGTRGNRPVVLWPVLPAFFVIVTLAIAGYAFHFRWTTDSAGVLKALIVLPLGLVVYGLVKLTRSPVSPIAPPK
ncbi:Serine/threonine exchanger SteT [Roseimaritima multifibrata]|uniref:Serine/threonine exchanger SteT n=1 Tax=Roseimaritima multifibrata TaxID=1930274 RepID=A0A517MDN0_9BACT|nr:APC family permease [Roseimaritima multifibrata]QDS92992.1 Serine/threonine exchanger SteT [Roseimaritima multifibrata]